jgi:hypothetical protein
MKLIRFGGLCRGLGDGLCGGSTSLKAFLKNTKIGSRVAFLAQEKTKFI